MNFCWKIKLSLKLEILFNKWGNIMIKVWVRSNLKNYWRAGSFCWLHRAGLSGLVTGFFEIRWDSLISIRNQMNKIIQIKAPLLVKQYQRLFPNMRMIRKKKKSKIAVNQIALMFQGLQEFWLVKDTLQPQNKS